MAKRGPKPMTLEEQEIRGSWRARKRRLAERRARNPRMVPAPSHPRPVRALRRKCQQGIPGYDPWASPGGARFSLRAAQQAVRFFESQLHHVKGQLAGKPFLLEPWQQAIIGNLFGWLMPNGTRRYRETFVFVPRKNGKTPMAAGILLYLLFEDGEPGAEIYGAAAEYKQASLVFEHARGMVHQNQRLHDQCKVYSGQAKAIQLERDFSTYRVIASDAYSSHGYNTHAYVVDELHTQPNAELVDTLETSTGAREQPLAILITTSDYEREGSVCNEKQDYARQVRDRVIDDPQFLPVLYETGLDEDWHDEKVWARVNPNLGVSLSWEYLRAAYQKAREIPRLQNTFRRLHLNTRTESDVRWLALEAWDACDAPVDIERLAGRTCYAGLDMSTTTDLTALSLLFPADDETYDVLQFAFIPRLNAIARERRDRVPYLAWERLGHLDVTEGNVVDYDAVRAKINKLGQVYDIAEIAIDRWNSTQLQTQLGGDGFTVVPFGQGFASMTAPTKKLEELVLGRRLRHGANPVLRWCISNAMVELDAAGNVKLSKKKSSERIDCAVALVMALGRASVRTDGGSVYDTRDLVIG